MIGPWTLVEDDDGGDFEVQQAHAPVALIVGPKTLERLGMLDPEDFEHANAVVGCQRAHASLIAAAPRLLAAARTMHRMVVDDLAGIHEPTDDEANGILTELGDAIAQARGGAG